jgi:tRNA pseudouridine38-40 synthase
MTRYALGIEYDGSQFCGWQVQSGVETVQEAIERALGAVANHSTRVVTAGRTDTGVHATGQVIHFDSASRRTLNSWIRGVNSNLPAGVVVTWAKEVSPSFHARFCARARSYRYIILSRPVRPTILARRVTWTHQLLNVQAMRSAAKDLLGQHDFSAYRSVHCQSRQPIRSIHHFAVGQSGAWTWFDIQADGFLHHMVRNIAGVLMPIGAEEKAPSWAREVLMSRERSHAGVTAPAGGLYLSRVDYPEHFDIPSPTNPISFW